MHLPHISTRPAFGQRISITIAVTLLMMGCDHKESASANSVDIQKYIERAQSYHNQGQYRPAIIEARNALQQNPSDRAAILNLAKIFNELGQGKPSIKLLEPLAKDASHDEALALAEAYFLQRKYQSALNYLETQSQRLNLANDPQANLIQARSLLQLGELELARAELAKLNEADPQVALEQIRLLEQSNIEAAQELLEKRLQQHPHNIELLSEAAYLAEHRGDLDHAEDILGKALLDMPSADILLPQKAAVLQRLITTLTKLGRSNEALIYAKALSDANPTGALLQDKLQQGVELFQAGKLDEAEPILTEVFNESQNDTVGMLLGMIHYAKKDLNGAANYLGNNIDPETAPDEALLTLAATQLQLAQPQKLLALFDVKDRKNIKNPALRMLIGIALLQTGSADEGNNLIQSALTDQPDNAAFKATLARYYLSSLQPDKAIAILEPATKNRADEHLTRLLVSAYVFAKQPDQALATAKTLANSTATQPDNWWLLGRTALYLQRWDVAESALRAALAQNHDFLPAQLDLGKLKLLQNKSDDAESIYRAALKQNPDHLGALRGLAIALKQKDIQGDQYESQLLGVSNTDNAKLVLTEIYLREQKLDDAERILKTLPRTTASDHVQQLNQDVALMHATQALQKNDLKSARDFIAKGLDINPNNLSLLALMARIELHEKNISGAKKIAQQLSQSQAASPQLLELQGDIAQYEGDNTTASQYFRKAWLQAPNDGIAQKLYLSMSKDSAAATSFLTEWLQQLPRSSDVHFWRGLNLQLAEKNLGAITEYETAIQLNQKNINALNNLAWLYGESNDHRALEVADAAYKLQPGDPAILDTYGWILARSGKKEDGLKALVRASELDPSSPQIKEHIEKAKKF